MPLFFVWFALQISPLNQAIALLEQGRPAEAIPILSSLIKSNPHDPVVWKALGVAHATLNQYELAEPAFAEACKLAPKLADACYFQGRALYALNRFEASLKALEQAPSSSKVKLGVGQALEALGRFDEAEHALQEAQNPTDPGPSVALGLLYLRTGRTPQAEQILTTTVARFPNSVDARVHLARALLERQAIDLAIAQLERALVLAPDNAQAHLLLAKAYMRQGRDKDAKPHFEAARPTK